MEEFTFHPCYATMDSAPLDIALTLNLFHIDELDSTPTLNYR